MTLTIIILIVNILVGDSPVAFLQNKDGYVNPHELNLAHGGVITGNIGMGKSTLRMHILSYLNKEKYQIIDFDFKGETSDYLLHRDSVIVPGVNFQFNLFRRYSSNPYEDAIFLTKVIELGSDELTPPQRSLLREALTRTLLEDGNIETFFDYIQYLGNLSNEYTNYSNKTSIALLDRLKWLILDLGQIFNTEADSIDLFNENQDYYFDLSYLKTVISTKEVKNLVEIILLIMTRYDNAKKKIIFLEEVQILLQDSSSVIEEIITTLRHRNIGVFLCGTRMDRTSKLLLDSGVFFQFHTDFEFIGVNKLQHSPVPYQTVLTTPKIKSEIYNVLPFNYIIENKLVKFQHHDKVINVTWNAKDLRVSIFRGAVRDQFGNKDSTLNIGFHYLDYQNFELSKTIKLLTSIFNAGGENLRSIISTYLLAHAEIIIDHKINTPLNSFQKWIDEVLDKFQIFLKETEEKHLLQEINNNTSM